MKIMMIRQFERRLFQMLIVNANVRLNVDVDVNVSWTHPWAEVLLGCNGFVWVGTPSTATSTADAAEAAEAEASRSQEVVGPEAREQICRVANAVRVLAALFLAIHPPVRVAHSHPMGQVVVPVAVTVDASTRRRLFEASLSTPMPLTAKHRL